VERKGVERKGVERKGIERKGKESKGKERKGKERKGMERKGKERKGEESEPNNHKCTLHVCAPLKAPLTPSLCLPIRTDLTYRCDYLPDQHVAQKPLGRRGRTCKLAEVLAWAHATDVHYNTLIYGRT
jgi:hypothetical protein